MSSTPDEKSDKTSETTETDNIPSPSPPSSSTESEEELLEESELSALDTGSLSELLRVATSDVPPPQKDVLRGVQKRLRERSKGKFYNDGWATREDNPRTTYMLTAAIMLILLVIAYWALVPGGFGKIP
jgi:hypothetical protein